MAQDFQVPAIFQNKAMSPAFAAALNSQEDSLADGIGQSYGVIGYRGKQWSLRYRGQRHDFLDAQGFGVPFLDVVILQQAKTKSKSFYPDYKDDSTDRPTCASMDGVVPDLDVRERQCESCTLCPRNVWKTDPQTGRKSRECTDYKRLAVLILPNQTKALLGEPLMEPVFLRVPPASLNSLAIMGDTMKGQGFHYASYITRVTFDPSKSHPQMVFRPIQQLTDAESPVILKMRDEPLASRIIGTGTGTMHAVQQALLAPARVESGISAFHDERSGTATVIPLVPRQPTLPLPVKAAAPAATPLTASPAIPAWEDGAFGGATTATTAAASAPSSNTPSLSPAVSDAGEPEESDAELDARIASMITK